MIPLHILGGLKSIPHSFIMEVTEVEPVMPLPVLTEATPAPELRTCITTTASSQATYSSPKIIRRRRNTVATYVFEKCGKDYYSDKIGRKWLGCEFEGCDTW